MPIVGIPVSAVAGAGSSWKPSDVKDIIEGIMTLYKMTKGGGDSAPSSPQVFQSEPRAPQTPQKCKVEIAFENLYVLCQTMVQTGHGDDKLATLIDIPNLTVKDAMQVLGKSIGR